MVDSERNRNTRYLPLEVWHAVFDMIVNGYYLWLHAGQTKQITLYACCLTCSAWEPYARGCLYRDIKIRNTTQTQKLTRTLLHLRPKNAEYIETLECVFPGKGQISSCILPPVKFPNLRTLSLEFLGQKFSDFNLDVTRACRHLRPVLEELSIDSYVEEEGPASQFLRLVHGFPGIKKLKIIQIPPFTSPVQFKKICKGKLGPSLCELELQEPGTSDSHAFLSYLIQSSNTPNTLHTLHITMTRCSSHAIHGLNDFLKACGPTLKYLSLTTASVTWIDFTGEQPKNYALDLQHNYKLSHLRLDLYGVFQEETLSWYLDTLATIRTGNLVVELDQVEAGLDYTKTLEPALLNMDVTKLTIRATLSGFTKGPSQPKIWEMFPQLHKLGILEGCPTHVLKATG